MSATLVEFARWEAAPLEAVRADVATVPAKVAPEKVPNAGTTDKITNIDQLPSIWTLEQPIEWLIDGIIPLGSVNLITSESGTGKTWVAYAIAGAVARGEGFAAHCREATSGALSGWRKSPVCGQAATVRSRHP